LFVAVKSLQTAPRVAEGTRPVEALAGGIRVALTIGGVISLFAIVTAFFIRKPADQTGAMGRGH
jgi:DHA2 family lincomycin resistance protein-like MFS transporter